MPNIGQYKEQWLVHKLLIDKLLEQLSKTKEQCITILSIIKPIKLKRSILQELPDTKRTHILSMFDRVDDTMRDFKPTSQECMDQFAELIDFFDSLLQSASSKHHSHPLPSSSSQKQNKSTPIYQEYNVDHEAHLIRRQQYAEVIVELEDFLVDAQKQCQTISAALRTGASEMAKSDDKTEWLSITTSINRNADTSLNLIHNVLEESLKEIKTAGILLMQNDKQIERSQQHLAFLTDSLEKERKKYQNDIENYAVVIRKEKDKTAYLNEQLHQERTLSERRSSEVRRLEKEIEKW